AGLCGGQRLEYHYPEPRRLRPTCPPDGAHSPALAPEPRLPARGSRMRYSLLLLTLAVAAGPACGQSIDFNRDVPPILSNSCSPCHGPDEKVRKVDLRLDTREGATADRDGHAAVVPGKPEESVLVKRLTADKPGKRMPPAKTGKTLSKVEIDTLTRWVKEGAPYAKHWAYVPPARPELPAVKNAAWPKNPIDRFILARL